MQTTELFWWVMLVLNITLFVILMTGIFTIVMPYFWKEWSAYRASQKTRKEISLSAEQLRALKSFRVSSDWPPGPSQFWCDRHKIWWYPSDSIACPECLKDPKMGK